MERFIYSMECEGGKYYIGQSTNVSGRFRKHLVGKGSWFTRLHKPLNIYEQHCVGDISESDCLELEDRLTAAYIRRFGVDNVRGGRFIQKEPKWFRRAMRKHNLT